MDKFHAENTYLICLNDQKIVGMLAARGNRPFSLDQKVADLDTHLPKNRTVQKSADCSRLINPFVVRAADRSSPVCWPCCGNTASNAATISRSFRERCGSCVFINISVSCRLVRWSARATRSSNRCM